MSERKQSWSFQHASLERSYLWSLAITVLPVIAGFIVSWVMARFAGARVVGTVSWVMSFATALLILAKFGLDLSSSQLASEYGVTQPGRLRSLFRTGIGLRGLFTVATAVPAFAFAGPLAGFFHDASLTTPIRLGAAIVVCASLYEYQENFLIGLNRLATVYKIRLVQLGLRVILTVAIVWAGYEATSILGGYCVAWATAIVAYVIMLHRYLPQGEKGETGGGVRRRLLLLSIPLALSSASVTVYNHMDRLMLGYFTGVEEVGQYAVARNTTEVTLFPVFAMVMMLRPALASRFAVGEISRCARVIEGALRFSLVSGVLFGSIFALLAVPLVTWVFSPAFTYAGELMLFFVGIIALRSVGAIIVPALVAADRTKTYAIITTVSAVLNFVLNVILIPLLQARGAIVATIVSYGILLVLGLREVFNVYGVRFRARGVWLGVRTLLAGSIAVGIVWQLAGHPTPGWPAFLWAGVLSIIYFLMILALRVGNLSDFRVVFANLRKSNA